RKRRVVIAPAPVARSDDGLERRLAEYVVGRLEHCRPADFARSRHDEATDRPSFLCVANRTSRVIGTRHDGRYEGFQQSDRSRRLVAERERPGRAPPSAAVANAEPRAAEILPVQARGEQASVANVIELEPIAQAAPLAEVPPLPVVRFGRTRHARAAVLGEPEIEALIAGRPVHQAAPHAGRVELRFAGRGLEGRRSRGEHRKRCRPAQQPAESARPTHCLFSIVTRGCKVFSLIRPRISRTCGARGAIFAAASISAVASAYMPLSHQAYERLL